jgi:hypothetical protein
LVFVTKNVAATRGDAKSAANSTSGARRNNIPNE